VETKDKFFLYGLGALATFAWEASQFDYGSVWQVFGITGLNLILAAAWPLHWLVVLFR
jgi:hypothetical protein